MPEDFDVARARWETRACCDVIHFNNAGASLMPVPVSDALHTYLNKEEYRGGYETEDQESEALANFYKTAALMLNCSEDEIAFAENATRAWSMAFYAFRFSPGDKILTTCAEYGSNVVAYNQQAARHGAEIIFVPDDEYGRIDIKALENLCDNKVKLISISHIPSGGGLVNPAAEVGKVARAAGIPFLLDATQSMGQMPLEVDAIGCDILCGTGRKYLRGPRGTGLLYVRRRLIEKMEPPLLDQHAADLKSPTQYTIRPDAKRFETLEQYCAGKAALGIAIDYALSWTLEAIQARVWSLADNMRRKLSHLDGVRITDEGMERCGIVTFTAMQMPPERIKARLASHKINVTVSRGAANLVSFRQRGLDSVVRASVHYYNTLEEIDYFCAVLKKVLNEAYS